MSALVKNGDLVPNCAGEVTKAQAVAAMIAVGISPSMVIISANGNFDHLPEPKVRGGSYEVFAASARNGAFTKMELDAAMDHFDFEIPAGYGPTDFGTNDVNEAKRPKDCQGDDAITFMFEDFGTPQGQQALLSM
eukprot:gene28806-31995_t